VLRAINLSFSAGEIIAYVGLNGAGKSTTIKILTGLIADFEVQAYVLGMDVRTHALDINAELVIYLSMLHYLCAAPLEYLHFVGKLYSLDEAFIDNKIWELLQLFQLDSRANMRMTGFCKGCAKQYLSLTFQTYCLTKVVEGLRSDASE
jgi:ABC-2 type transport system ATP-binding protein